MVINFTQLGEWIHSNSLPVVLILVFFAQLLLVLMIIRYKNNRNRYRLIQEYLLAGKEVPPSLIKENSLYTRAVKNVILGIGLIFFFGFLTETWGWASAGLLFIALGVGQMIVFKRSNKDNTNGETDR